MSVISKLRPNRVNAARSGPTVVLVHTQRRPHPTSRTALLRPGEGTHIAVVGRVAHCG